MSNEAIDSKRDSKSYQLRKLKEYKKTIIFA